MPYEGFQLGHFKLLNLIGSGGMGEVYLSEDTRIHRQVAVKVIRAELTPYPDVSATREAARLFQREMRAVTMLDHPHILPLYDFGEETINKATLTYMVMPYRKEGLLMIGYISAAVLKSSCHKMLGILSCRPLALCSMLMTIMSSIRMSSLPTSSSMAQTTIPTFLTCCWLISALLSSLPQHPV